MKKKNMFISKNSPLWEIQEIDDNSSILLDHLGKPSIINICCYIICWPPSEFSVFKNLPTFKWRIVNSRLCKRLLELSSIYMKKLWTLSLNYW